MLERPDFGADCFGITIQLDNAQLDHSLLFEELIEFFAEFQPSSFRDGVEILSCSVYLYSVFSCLLLLPVLCSHVVKHFEVDSKPIQHLDVFYMLLKQVVNQPEYNFYLPSTFVAEWFVGLGVQGERIGSLEAVVRFLFVLPEAVFSHEAATL